MTVRTQPAASSFPRPEKEHDEHQSADGRGRDRDEVEERDQLPVAELVQTILVDPEVVRQLVQDGNANLVLQSRGVVAEVVLERPAVDRDPRRQVLVDLKQPKQVGFLRVLLLDDDRDVVERSRELGRQRVERATDVRVERHQYAGRSGGRFLTRKTVSTPNAKPPMWAKKATPPPASGCSRPRPPCQI